MENNVNDMILKIARGENVENKELDSIASLFANTTTNAVVFAMKAESAKWKKLLDEADLTSTLFISEDEWQQNIDRALEIGDIIIIDNVEQSEEIYNMLNACEKIKTKVIIRNYPIPADTKPNGINIYRNTMYIKPRALRYAKKVSVVLRHAVIPFNTSSIPVLLVDDVPINKTLLSIMLKKTGYNEHLIYKASNNIEAISQIEKHIPMIIVTDVNHIGGDGRDLVNMISEKEEFDDIVLFFTTAQNSLADENLCYQSGGDCFMSKPIYPQPFTAHINSIALTAQYVKVYNKVMK